MKMNLTAIVPDTCIAVLIITEIVHISPSGRQGEQSFRFQYNIAIFFFY